jgi:outer membrane biosynthesis protein TonB
MKKLLFAVILAALAASTACASAQAKSPADHPNLEVPPVPPRVIESKPLEPPPPEPVEELPPVSPLPPRPRPAPRETVKAEPKPPEQAPATATAAPADQPPPVAAPAAPPVPQLRTPGSVDDAEAARQVHDVIERAKRALGLIDYRHLSTERRSQFDNARMMVTQAENALKKSDFEFARNLAEKADRLATELQGR